MSRPLRLFATAAVAFGASAVLPRHAAVAQDAGGTGGSAAPKPIKALLVIGGCCHDYARQKVILQKGISARAPVEFTVCHEGDGKQDHRHSVYEKPDWHKGYDVVVHDECTSQVKDVAFVDGILKAHRDGVPAVVLHCGMHSYRSEGFPAETPWFGFTGLASTGHGPKVPLAVTFTDQQSPITRGLADWTTGNEELYNNSAGKLMDTATPLATGRQSVVDKKTKRAKDVEAVVAWTNAYGEGKTKVFATTLGHDNATVADARYLNLVTRGLLWSVGKLDERHFKASDQNVDATAIPGGPAVEPKKAGPTKTAARPTGATAAPAGGEPRVEPGCCGA